MHTKISIRWMNNLKGFLCKNNRFKIKLFSKCISSNMSSVFSTDTTLYDRMSRETPMSQNNEGPISVLIVDLYNDQKVVVKLKISSHKHDQSPFYCIKK